MLLVVVAVQDGQGLRDHLSARWNAGTRNGASASIVDDPRRNRRRKTLGEKRAERLVFPRLYVASRPVVQEAESEGVLLGLRRSESDDRVRCRHR